jgi:non-ribosomal peptide synthase protein (TIGR01720 family)
LFGRTELAPLDSGPYSLRCRCSIQDGCLRAEWTSLSHAYDADAVERIAREFLVALEDLILHCRSENAGGYTPSDFPHAELSQADLDRFLVAFSRSST